MNKDTLTRIKEAVSRRGMFALIPSLAAKARNNGLKSTTNTTASLTNKTYADASAAKNVIDNKTIGRRESIADMLRASFGSGMVGNSTRSIATKAPSLHKAMAKVVEQIFL